MSCHVRDSLETQAHDALVFEDDVFVAFQIAEVPAGPPCSAADPT